MKTPTIKVSVRQYLLNISNDIKETDPVVRKWDKRDLHLFYFLSFLLITLLYGTSIYSDDYEGINLSQNKSVSELLIPQSNAITVPLTQYFFHIFYNISSYDFMLPVMLAKIFWAIVCLYGVSKYLSLWLDVQFSLIFSFIWICIPLHDATFYWLIGQYLIVSCAFIFYAAYELERGNKRSCVIFMVLGSWVSYGSPAIAFSLFFVFLLRGLWRKGLYILIPNLIYCIYYVVCTKYFSVYISRINTEVGIVHLVKNFFKQVFTFLDSSLGPSMFLKIYYTICNINLIGLALALGAIYGIHRLYKDKEKKIKPSSIVILLFSTLLFFNIAMFTVTGAYPHLAFNLGNRVGTYSIFIILFLIMALTSRLKFGTSALVFLLVLSFYGNRAKFLDIERAQQNVVNNIGQNQALKNFDPGTPLFVTGNQYHKLGPFSDIEFLSANWVFNGILRGHYGKDYQVYSLNRKWILEDGVLLDRKDGVRVPILYDGISVYDSVNNELKIVQLDEIKDYISNLEKNKRHWLQFIENESVKKFINSKIKRLSYDL